MALTAPIIITLAGEDIVLRPSLACAMQLERRPGSFKAILADVMGDSLTAASEIIAAHHGHPQLAARIMDAGLDNLRPALIAYVLQCAGMNPDARPPANDNPDHKPRSIPFADYLQQLFRIGTGWLGWTPATTLDATPLEIMEAYKGRLDLMKAIFGSADEEAQPQPDARTLDDKFRAVFGSLGTTVVRKAG